MPGSVKQFLSGHTFTYSFIQQSFPNDVPTITVSGIVLDRTVTKELMFMFRKEREHNQVNRYTRS